MSARGGREEEARAAVEDARARCLSELTERSLLPDERHAVYLSGSLVRGWGNPTSDLDVIVVAGAGGIPQTNGSRPATVTPGRLPVHSFYVGERRWEVEYWTLAQVAELLDAVSWERAEAGQVDLDKFTRADIAFAQRLPHGVVVEGEDWAAEHANAFGESALRSLVAERALEEYDRLTEDVVGMIAADDPYSAALSARLAFGYVVEALLAHHGEYSEQVKWRARRMLAVEPAELAFDDYWEIETMRAYTPATAADWAESVLRLCHDIVCEIEL